MYTLASSGRVDLDQVRDEITHAVTRLDIGSVRRDLLALDKYVLHRGNHPKPVPGWHLLSDETPVTLDQT